MKFYHVNAFTDTAAGGNPAGVVLCEGGKFCSDERMQEIAKDAGFSETAFVCNDHGKLNIRYFTPVQEVDLCGHASIGVFKALMHAGLIEPVADVTAYTKSGSINVKTEPRFISMSMGSARVLSTIKNHDSLKLVYMALGQKYDPVTFMPQCGTYMPLNPMVVTAGLPFLIVPINGRDKLNAIEPNLELVSEICKGLNCLGIYAFAFETKQIGTMAHCRGFYPLLGINEECATGTGVAALSFYLNGFGLFPEGREALFIQGEAMKCPSKLTSFIKGKGPNQQILIGGNACVVSEKEI